jgi:hypothetical protein
VKERRREVVEKHGMGEKEVVKEQKPVAFLRN